MGWKLLDKPKTVKVTKKLADQFATMNPAPHDRPLSTNRIATYRKILKAGGFRPVSWATALCVENGECYRVNGKHTSTMLAEMEDLPEFYAVIEDYECDTLEDVARLYATFDSKTQSRTSHDIYASFASTVPELAGIGMATITSAVIGMNLHLNTGGTYKYFKIQTPADRAELLIEHTDFVKWLSELLDGKSSKHLRRGPAVAAIFGTYRKAVAPSLEFWSAVRDETGTSPALPDRKLAKLLLTTGVDTGGGSHKLRPIDPREMYVKCIHAWNAWRKGEPTNLQYRPDKDIPAIK